MAGKGGGSSCGVSGSDSNILTRSQEDEAKSSGASLKKSKGPKVVKSRYLDYDKNLSGKGPLVNAFSGSFSKPAEKGRTPTQRSALPQKARPSACMQASALDYTPFGKDDLQSTLLEGHRIALPDLDLSAINDKSLPKKGQTPETLFKVKAKNPKKELSKAILPPLPDQDLLEMIESQTLLFTCLCSKMERNVKQLEEKAERNLLILAKEKEKLQREVHEQKRKILLQRKDRHLKEALSKQVEVLQPLTAKTEKFNAEYNHFATALDTTRHELPVKSIHIEGDRQGYLAEVQSLLTDAGKLLSELVLMPSSEVSQTSNLLKDLKGLALKTDTEVKRGCTEALQLSAAVSQEASLRHQQLSEEVHESQTLANWYFS
ncbi:HAUS augmin-like complex subunit 8 [Latimeria chalumnae]|uniref:HAUS augmin-like complex subunit 8 n=1 Tax=Latimeria chalumnae TaxID=7897 RepID=UPI0006D8FF11|nr:PREDICTED: HAUS augmin-like complex subunit 8 [Latimeria chalumnae]|eukprot:XP_006005950.2 PREDICTED: HAUS augmin-like complex subunit 8 [Latimeria chalumnae]